MYREPAVCCRGEVIEMLFCFHAFAFFFNQSKTRFLLSYIISALFSLSLDHHSSLLPQLGAEAFKTSASLSHVIHFLSFLNENRCTLDPVIMPNFQQLKNHYRAEDRSPEGQRHQQKILYTTFPAFKFPDRFSLHIQCSLVICNTTCPKVRENETNKTKTKPDYLSLNKSRSHFPSFHSSFSRHYFSHFPFSSIASHYFSLHLRAALEPVCTCQCSSFTCRPASHSQLLSSSQLIPLTQLPFASIFPLSPLSFTS